MENHKKLVTTWNLGERKRNFAGRALQMQNAVEHLPFEDLDLRRSVGFPHRALRPDLCRGLDAWPKGTKQGRWAKVAPHPCGKRMLRKKRNKGLIPAILTFLIPGRGPMKSGLPAGKRIFSKKGRQNSIPLSSVLNHPKPAMEQTTDGNGAKGTPIVGVVGRERTARLPVGGKTRHCLPGAGSLWEKLNVEHFLWNVGRGRKTPRAATQRQIFGACACDYCFVSRGDGRARCQRCCWRRETVGRFR